MSGLYKLCCEYCGYNRVFDGSSGGGLVEYRLSDVPTGYPKIDPVKNETVVPKPIKRPKKFKCPGCGRMVGVRNLGGGSGDEKTWIA